jgi:hypothetical protein
MSPPQDNPDNLLPVSTPGAHAPDGPSAPDEPFAIPPLAAASQAAFRRALPELLRQRPRQWVAFHGDERLGFARTEAELYEACARRGLAEDQFVVRFILPEPPPDADVTPPFQT